MDLRTTLSSILRGETAADLTPQSRAELERFASEAQAAGLAQAVRDECAGRQRQPGCSAGVDYLLGLACALNSDRERALQVFLALGERLAAAEDWEPLVAVAEHGLELEPTHAGARLLVRAHEALAHDPERIAALERAFAILPEDLDLGLLLAQRLGESGDAAGRHWLLARMLPAFAAQDRLVGLEEAALEFVDHHVVDGLITLIGVLPGPAERGALAPCSAIVGIAFPEVARAGRAGEVEEPLRALARAGIALEGAAGALRFRVPLVEALRQGSGAALPDREAVIAASGVAEPARALLEGLDRFDRIAALPPGRAVWHDNFQAGRITADDGESVVLDFARSKAHRMPYAAARRTLVLLEEDDLRLLRLARPQEVTRLRTAEPAEMLARALRAIGGTADAQRLKVFLVGSDLVRATEWNAFWRQVRAKAPSHPRIDVSRAFEQVYRLRAADEVVTAAGEGGTAAADVPLPAIEVRKPARVNLASIRKFLVQHPDAEPALAQRFGRFIERTMMAEDAEPADRVRAGLYFARWFPDRAGEWSIVLARLWEDGLGVTDLSAETEQLALLLASQGRGIEGDAILSALDSRFSAVREEAERLRADLDEPGRVELRHALLLHGTRHPGAAMRLMEEELATDPPPADAWLVLWSALALIEDRPKRSVAEKVLRWIEPGGPFERILAERACPDEVQLKLRILFRSWRSSDRYLFPALEAIELFGLGGEAAAIRGARQKRTDKLFEGVGQQAEGTELPVMTHATWERLQGELDRLERELRTTIPAAIQKARELGDLSENAEYHAAKQKQANVSQLVSSIQLRLARARFVDEVQYRDGIVGLGTEVVLEGVDQELRTFWILGEDEHHLGDHVISFQTPVGRALMGHGIGDEVELGEGAERRAWRVVSVERRLPEREG